MFRVLGVYNFAQSMNQNQHSYNLDEVKKEVTFLGKKEQVCTDMYSFHFIAQI